MSPAGLTTQASDECPPVDKDSMAEVWLQVELGQALCKNTQRGQEFRPALSAAGTPSCPACQLLARGGLITTTVNTPTPPRNTCCAPGNSQPCQSRQVGRRLRRITGAVSFCALSTRLQMKYISRRKIYWPCRRNCVVSE
ncbi:hypothetical protein PO909_030653 [Leuciscus waleckii]